MKEIYSNFNQYVKQFDMKEPHIRLKFHHSYRVMEFSKEIAQSINLTEEEVKLASIIGLFHDIGRFEQWKVYETFNDRKSVDHGDFGRKVMEGLIDDLTTKKEEQTIIYKSIQNHNKYEIENGLSKKELLMAKIVRDADKLDIMKEQCILKKESEVKEILVNHLWNHEKINSKYVDNQMDSLLRMLAFLFDFHFAYSYQFVLKEHIIEKVINLIEIYGHTNLQDIQTNLINYTKERLEC